jgi:hypothetical protein
MNNEANHSQMRNQITAKISQLSTELPVTTTEVALRRKRVRVLGDRNSASAGR